MVSKNTGSLNQAIHFLNILDWLTEIRPGNILSKYIEGSEIIPANLHSPDRGFWNHTNQYTFLRNKSRIDTIYSLYGAGMDPNQISHTFPYPNLYSYEFAADSLFHRLRNSQPEPIYLHGKSLSVAESVIEFAMIVTSNCQDRFVSRMFTADGWSLKSPSRVMCNRMNGRAIDPTNQKVNECGEWESPCI